MSYMRWAGFTFVSVLVLFISACGGGGGGSSASGSGSSGGSSTGATMDAAGREIVAAIGQAGKSGAGVLSAQVGSPTASRMNARIGMIPIMSGGTLTGMIITYIDHTVAGAYGGSTVLNGTVVGHGDASGGDAQSEPGMTRKFQSIMSESGKWEFNGTLDVDVRGSGYGGSPLFMIGTITDTLNSAIGMTATNTANGDVYVFDDYRVQVNLSGDAIVQNVYCSQEPSSFILLHKQGGGSIMSCILDADCACK